MAKENLGHSKESVAQAFCLCTFGVRSGKLLGFIVSQRDIEVDPDKMHVPLTPLNILSSPWPFSMWGIDMIRMIELKASNGHQFILVAIDYFTKWVEAVSYANVTRKMVTRFIKQNLICRYGVPSRIITDNGSNLNNKMMKELCDNFKIKHHNSSPYRPKMNRDVEVANKNIKKII